MGTSLGPQVVFDFDGSLRLARASWQMADQLDHLLGERRDHAGTALTDWSGEYATEFVQRANDEQQTGASIVSQLRSEAESWAVEWKHAMDQENWNRYQAKVKQVERDRSLLDDIGGFFFGHDDLPPTPAEAAVPTSPGFWPTRDFAHY